MPIKDPTDVPFGTATASAVPDAGQSTGDTAQALVAAVLPDPTAGGNYLRDPVTGALSLNPAFAAPTPTPTPQE